MNKYIFRIVSIITFLCISRLCVSQELPFESLVIGVNQARTTIETGEMSVLVTLYHPARKSPEEIRASIEKNKEEALRENHDEETIRELFKEIPVEEEWFFGEHEDVEKSNVAFRIFDHDSTHLEGYQFKMNQIDRREINLYSDRAKYLDGGYHRMLTYDAQVQVYEEIAPTIGIAFDNHDAWLGFLHFHFLGRSRYRMPPDAKLMKKEVIGEADCYVLEFQPEGKTAANLVRIWVDPQKHFCIRREERYKDGYTWEMVYQDFQMHGDIWFPKVSRLTGKTQGKVESSWTIVVNEAHFNLDFPPNFFKVDPDTYLNQNLELLPGSKAVTDLKRTLYQPSPDIPQIESDLLRCGPNSLLRVCEILKVDANFDEICRLSDFNPNVGTTMLGLHQAARDKNLNPKGIKASMKTLRTVSMPAIAYVGGNHFLVFEKVMSDGVVIFDPANKYDYYLSSEELSQLWGGELLIFDYKDEFSQSESMPYVHIDSNYYDFGAAPGGSQIKHTFKLKNTGSEILTIFKVERSCNCTATIVSQDEIPPGQYGAIETVLKVPSENREVEERIYVYTNSPTQNKIPLTVKGTAFLPISTFPDQVYFGKVAPRRTLRKILTVHRATGKDIQITGVRVNSSDLTAEIVSNEESEITRIEVTILESVPVGQFICRLSVGYSYEGEKATHDVTVRGEVLGVFDVSPKKLFFGLVNGEKSVSKTVTISPVNSQPFEITEVLSDSKFVTTKIIPRADAGGYHMLVMVNRNVPNASSGEFSGEIVMKTNSTTQPTIRVPFVGIISDEN